MNRIVSVAVVAGLTVLASLTLNNYQLHLGSQIFMAATVALGLVLMAGVAGLSSFAQAAFVGIAAYTTAVCTVSFGISPWLTLPLAIAIVMGVALIAGAVTVGLSGHYLPLCTLAWALAIYNVFGNVGGLGRFEGIGNIPAVTLVGLALEGPLALIMSGMVFLCLLLLCWNLLDSRIGRALRTLALGRQMPECMGINTYRLRLVLFVLAAIFAAFAGWLYAHIQRFVNPSPFGLDAGVEYLFMALLGGAASLWGALIGAIVLIIAREWLKQLLPGIIGHAGDFEIVVFSIGLILLMQRAPGGLTLWWNTLRAARASRRASQISVTGEVAAALPRRAQPPRGEILLSAKNVGRRFGGLIANEAISLEAKGGEILAVIGPNGAGKSTLFNLLSGVDRPDEGEVRLAGQRIDGREARDICKLGLARTFQHVKLMNDVSVLDNVAVGAHLRGHAGWLRALLRLNRDEERALLAEAMKQAQLCGLADRAHERAGSLPLGLQRIVEVARALASDPALLMLDEPAAGLRANEKQILAGLLADLRARGIGIVIVEHDMDFVMSLADRIVVLNFGRVLAKGSPAEIQSDPKVLEAYLGQPS